MFELIIILKLGIRFIQKIATFLKFILFEIVCVCVHISGFDKSNHLNTDTK